MFDYQQFVQNIRHCIELPQVLCLADCLYLKNNLAGFIQRPFKDNN